MDYAVLIAVVLLNSALFIDSGVYSKKSKTNAPLFAIAASLATVLFFFIYNNFSFTFNWRCTYLALLSAACSVCATFSNINAMKYGSVALTSMIASFSLLLPTAFGILYWKEPISLWFVVGIILFCISVVLTNLEKAAKDQAPTNKENATDKPAKKKHRFVSLRWVVFAAGLFFSNGISAILSTYYQRTGGADFRAEYVITSASIAITVNLILAISQLKKTIGGYIKNAAVFGGTYGLLNAGISLGVMILAANRVIPQSIFYPVISAGVLVLVFVASLIFFKEKFSKYQLAGVGLSVIAICLLQM